MSKDVYIFPPDAPTGQTHVIVDNSGQQTMINSVPVVIASNQSNLPVTLQNSTANIGQTIPNRPSQGVGRTHVAASLSVQTGTAIVYTVTAGKTLYVTNTMIDFYNTNTGANGDVRIQDDTAVKVPMLVPPAVNGQNAPNNGGDALLWQEPRQFKTNFKVVVVTGTIIYSISFSGYEE